MTNSQSIKERKRAREMLKETNAVVDDLEERGKALLQNQATLLCQALQQLYRRCDSGHELANEIWDSLIDGTSKIPNFDEHVFKFFWPSLENVPDEERAFYSLLRQAQLKKQLRALLGSGDEHPSNNLIMTVTEKKKNKKKQRAKSEISAIIDTIAIPITGAKIDAAQRGRKLVKVKEDKLLSYLITMLKVAAEKTRVVIWKWEKENDGFKAELELFNKSLQLALQLFEEIRKSSDLQQLMDIMERIPNFGLGGEVSCSKSSLAKLNNDADALKGSDVEEDRESSAASPASLPLEENNEEEEEEEEEDEEDNDPNSECSSSESESVSPTPPPEERKRRKDLIVCKPGAANPSKYVSLKSQPCSHAGCPLVQNHYRDWKRDGYRCICGQKFSSLNSTERHVRIIIESRSIKCKYCDFKVNRKCCMDKHNKDLHDQPNTARASDRLYQCQYGCQGIFRTKGLMYNHQKETDRQCKFKNADKLPIKYLPTTVDTFVETARSTLARANKELTADALDKIITAAEKDAVRIRIELSAKSASSTTNIP